MGFSKKQSVDLGLDSDSKKWVIAGISIRTSLKPINTKHLAKDTEEENESECPTTPTTTESRIPENLPCPPAPAKRRPALRCRCNSDKVFFTPPDLETVFIRYAGKTN